MYKVKDELINNRPEIRVGDRVFCIDNRLSVYRAINKALQDEPQADELEVVLKNALGEGAFAEIIEMDLAFAAMQEMLFIVLAAIQDLPLEEAQKRFRKQGK